MLPVDMLREFKPGDILTAENLNALRRAALSRLAGGAMTSDSDSTALYVPRQRVLSDLVSIKNAAGEEIPRGAIVQPTTPFTGDSYDGWNVDAPDDDWRADYLVVMFDDIPSDAEGWASWLFGQPDLALYDVSGSVPAEGETWGPKAGEYFLVKGGYGFLCVGEADEDRVLAKFKQFPPQLMWGTSDGNVAEDGSGDVLLKDTSFSSLGIYGRDVLNKGMDIDSTNRDVSIGVIAGRLVMTAFKCATGS